MPAKYQLLIDHKTFNNIEYKTVLNNLTIFSGPGCLKKSAIYQIGYKLEGNVQCGLNPIKKISL